MSTELAVATPPQAQGLQIWTSESGFELAQRMAGALAKSDLVPVQFKNNISNCMLALELAQRINSSVMAVMQNIHIIEGKPSWASQYVIAALNACGRFSPLRFRIEEAGKKTVKYTYYAGRGDNRERKEGAVEIRDQRCVAWAYDKATNEVLEGPEVSIEMAVREGWYTKTGSKWQTMPDLMLRYRAAKFFGNLYAPDILHGMKSADEHEDIREEIVINPDPAPEQKPTAATVADLNAQIQEKARARGARRGGPAPSMTGMPPEPAGTVIDGSAELVDDGGMRPVPPLPGDDDKPLF